MGKQPALWMALQRFIFWGGTRTGHDLFNDITSCLVTTVPALSRQHECDVAHCMKRV